jgi:hypothetical protein
MPCPALRTYLPARVLAQQGHAATRRPLYCTGDGQSRPTVLCAAHGWVVRHIRRQSYACMVLTLVSWSAFLRYRGWIAMQFYVCLARLHSKNGGKYKDTQDTCAHHSKL